MRRTLLTILGVGAVLMAAAQGLTLRDRMMLGAPGMRMTQEGNLPSLTLRKPAAETMLSGMARLDGEAAVETLRDMGAEVHPLRHGFAVVTAPARMIESVARAKGVRQMSLMRPVTTKLDMARAVTGVDRIHRGEGLPMPYTGKGVIAGIVDNGFDPNHINFLNPDGSSRINTFSTMSVSQTGSVVQQWYGADDVLNLPTDDKTTYHGTHTLGIFAGSHRGRARVAQPDYEAACAVLGDMPNPYYGIAYDAELAVGAGATYDMLIAYNIEYLLDYAAWRKAPIVINLSLGGNEGPHDGTGIINQYLDEIADKDGAIVCVSAGNEGDMKIALHKTLTAEANTLRTFIDPGKDFRGEVTSPDGLVMHNARIGSVEIYSDSGQEFTLSLVVYNKTRGKVAWQKTIPGNTDGAPIYYVTSGAYSEDGDNVDVQLARYFDGYVGFGSMIDEGSGRYHAMVDCYTIDNPQGNADGNYIVGFVVTGADGQRIDCYANGQYIEFTDEAQPGWDDGMRDGTISDMATGHNQIVVGSYGTRPLWPALDGSLNLAPGGVELGAVTEYSSYGTLIDGRQLPHVLAPGATIISSASGPFIESVGAADHPEVLSATVSDDIRTHYYVQEQGTSMSAPVVSGIIALWLEADPTLTYADVRDIIARTAVKDEYTAMVDPVQVGYGKIDAYGGLKAVLERSGISDVVANPAQTLVTALGHNVYEVFVPGAATVTATVADMSGKTVGSHTATGPTLTVDLSALAPGIYIINSGPSSHKIIIR